LCASNVLLSKNKVAKLSDFGLSISLKKKTFAQNESLETNYPSKIRIKWTAPESLQGKNFSLKSDIWSFAIFLWEMFSYGRSPYPRVRVEELKSYLLNGYRMNPPESCPNEVYEIMKQCWQLNLEERPNFTYLRNCFSDLLIISDRNSVFSSFI